MSKEAQIRKTESTWQVVSPVEAKAINPFAPLWKRLKVVVQK